ncbi:MAG: F0F1 ATP synthase subunit A [Candidatus Omnitrophota bacterium]
MDNALEHFSEASQAAAHGATHEAHELPNWLSLLTERFPDSPLMQFLRHWETIAFSLIIAGGISALFLLASKRPNSLPGKLQNFCEILMEGLEGFVSGILGETQGKKHVPFLGTLFIYILCMNWFGLVPLMKSPTARWSITLAIALTTMVYIQLTGIREQGLLHYLKHLAGNPQNAFGIVLIPLMLVLNIILELGAVPFSLSLRLFANISSEDRLLLNFADLTIHSPFFIGFFFQIFANVLSIIFSFVQAFVFMLLSTVYISLVLPHDNTQHGAHEARAH